MNCMKFLREVYAPKKSEAKEKSKANGKGEVQHQDAQLSDYVADNKQKLMHQFAWDAMWKEVQFFWIRSGAAVFILGGGTTIQLNNELNEFQYGLVSVGLLFFAITWRQINMGSLDWMGNWMQHVDLLEDEVTGPLYKSVYLEYTHSTTKSINHLSMLAVWAASLNAIVGVFLAVKWVLNTYGFREDVAALRAGYCGALLLLFVLVYLFIRWNISFTENNERTLFLREVSRAEVAKRPAGPQESC